MAQDILRGNFDFNVDLFIFVLFVIVVFFFIFKVVPSLIIKILHKSNPKEHNSSCSSCLLSITLSGTHLQKLHFLYTVRAGV